MSFNSSFNSFMNINSLPMLFSSVFSHHKSEQHLNSDIVFSSLFFLSSKLSHSLIVDSPYTDTEFEELFLHFAYGSNSSLPLSTNNSTDSPTFLEEFEAFVALSLHVFSSFSLYYYSMC
jgi:hypothetical protein